ncbi:MULTISPECIES: hypothetical protein [unclassified Cryobacterium]|uniref:hypothetical protein n=1 Tax=unclassified Cryobacterium TaxID=2649013 RepID=UPI00106A813D|nr:MULTISPECIES: hypothetical protein [unclassified Cryobacterium]TFB98555.1 hypothetical protein E3O39_06870 [Cryobacterium sp. MDB2-A-1]TFC08438.1 hypothetical protein E3O59_08235 [Cryobacterium sp. MDB2-33-2]TFC08704.1 hypothetical protein E3O35_17540 [Cryobacterium sp. MDB2-A-2]TFC22240.1 hypothetical protein E3O51_02445 [Cryobacterium sp. MDB2-10]
MNPIGWLRFGPVGVATCFIRRMKPTFVPISSAKRTFADLLSASSQPVTLSEALVAYMDFYRDVRITDCPTINDGDMLLFQWGLYDWRDFNGQGLDVSLTRQFMPVGIDDDNDPPIIQLSLNLRYPAARALGLKDGNRWLSEPADVKDFAQWCRSTPVYSLVENEFPQHIELRLEDAE